MLVSLSSYVIKSHLSLFVNDDMANLSDTASKSLGEQALESQNSNTHFESRYYFGLFYSLNMIFVIVMIYIVI